MDEEIGDVGSTESREMALFLPKTGLAVMDDELVKLTPDERPSARYSFDEITGISLEKRFEPFSLVFDGIGVGLAYYAWTALDPGWVRTGLLAAGSLLLIFGLVGLFSSKVVVDYKDEAIVYTVADDDETVHGFVTSARDLLQARGNRRIGL